MMQRKRYHPWLQAVIEIQLPKMPAAKGVPSKRGVKNMMDLKAGDRRLSSESISESFYIADPDEVFQITSPWLH